MLLIDDDGRRLEGQFHLGDTPEDGAFSLVLDSAGGAKRGQGAARNKDYALVLRLLLERLAGMDATLDDCLVESARTSTLPDDERRIDPAPWVYPIRLRSVEDFEALRLALTRPQAQIASSSEAGGNERKRIRLHLRVSDWEMTSGRLLAGIRGTSGTDAEWEETEASSGRNESEPSPNWREPSDETQGRGSVRRQPRTIRGESSAIERHAVAMAVAHFQADGWSVRDVGTIASFDLICTKAGRVVHVEVKGTKGLGDQVSLYPQEVEHARGCADEVALFVVKNVEVRRSGEAVEASGGVAGLAMPWRISEALQPSEYRCPVPTEIAWQPQPNSAVGTL